MAENRRLYGIKPPPKEPHKPKPHPFRATSRHERWCLDIRYIEKHRIQEIKGSFYVITVMCQKPWFAAAPSGVSHVIGRRLYGGNVRGTAEAA